MSRSVTLASSSAMRASASMPELLSRGEAGGVLYNVDVYVWVARSARLRFLTLRGAGSYRPKAEVLNVGGS